MLLHVLSIVVRCVPDDVLSASLSYIVEQRMARGTFVSVENLICPTLAIVIVLSVAFLVVEIVRSLILELREVPITILLVDGMRVRGHLIVNLEVEKAILGVLYCFKQY